MRFIARGTLGLAHVERHLVASAICSPLYGLTNTAPGLSCSAAPTNWLSMITPSLSILLVNRFVHFPQQFFRRDYPRQPAHAFLVGRG